MSFDSFCAYTEIRARERIVQWARLTVFRGSYRQSAAIAMPMPVPLYDWLPPTVRWKIRVFGCVP